MASGISSHTCSGLPLLSFDGDLLTQPQIDIYTEALKTIEEAKTTTTSDSFKIFLKERICEAAYCAKNTVFFSPENIGLAQKYLDLSKRDLIVLKQNVL